MVTIFKATTNTVDITLNDLVTISAPVYFLFRLINDFTQVSKTFLCADTTNRQIPRYNRFSIIEGTPEDLTIGKISVTTGQYTVEIYAQTSSSNLDYTLANEKIFTGLASVIDNSVVISTSFAPTATITVFDPTS